MVIPENWLPGEPNNSKTESFLLYTYSHLYSYQKYMNVYNILKPSVGEGSRSKEDLTSVLSVL